MQPVPWWLVVLLDRITQPALKRKLSVSDDEINHHRSLRSLVAKFFAPGRGGDFIVSCTSGQKQNKSIVISGLVLRKTFPEQH